MLRVISNRNFKDNVVFIMLSLSVFLTEPALVHAQNSPYNPVNFTDPLSLSRGSLMPASPQGIYLSHDETCTLVQREFAWDPSSCSDIENIIFAHVPGLDNLIVEKPNSDGFVKFDDWDREESKEEIQAIWEELVEGSINQGEKLGIKIEPLKWVVYPHLDKDKSYMYYAILTRWGADNVINIKATKFDRLGYVTFRLVPDNENYVETELTQIVETTLNSYKPAANQSYFDFSSGDKVAAAGAVGVLAALVGVKYGKAIAGGAIAIALLLAKKVWFLVFLPFVFLYRKFRKKTQE